MPRYRYEYPSEWLAEYVNLYSDDPLRLRAVIWDLVSKLSEDDIQDLFQAEMEADGFFEDLDAVQEED